MRLMMKMVTNPRDLTEEEIKEELQKIQDELNNHKIDELEASRKTLAVEKMKAEQVVIGVKEEFQVYEYNGKGYIKVIAGYDENDLICEPMSYVGETLIPISERLSEKGISTPRERLKAIRSYVNAKDSFYSEMTTDSVIIEVQVGIDFTKLQDNPKEAILYDKSKYVLYLTDEYEEYVDDETGKTEWDMSFIPIEKDMFDSIEHFIEFDKKMEDLYMRIACCKGDKAQFIYDRAITHKVRGR